MSEPDADREYSPSSLVPDVGTHLAAYASRSRRARDTLAWTEVAYGPSPAERLHVFPAAPGAPDRPPPLHVFVHGGYWQELGVGDSAFAAPGFVAAGVSFAALGYGLAPAHPLDEITAMVRRGVLWVFRNAARLGIDPDRIFLSGMSAGAHLAAMCLLPGWLPDGLRPADVVRGAALLSGVYELGPLRSTYVGEAIALTPAQVADLSPARHVHAGMPALVVARGERETDAFGDQQAAFVAATRRHDVPVVDLVVPGRHHFDLPFDLADPRTRLGAAVRALMSR